MKINFKDKRILVLAPHTDDAELGCGGTISRALEDGAEVSYFVFSRCEQSVPEGLALDTLEREQRAAAASLGIAGANVSVFEFEVRKFPEQRQDILQTMIDRRRDISPDIVFMPCLNDIHQDHAVISMEGIRAFRGTTIFSYELPWNNLEIRSGAFCSLEERHVAAKMRALAEFKSQAFRNYMQHDYLAGQARMRGIQGGLEYAEMFEVVRLFI